MRVKVNGKNVTVPESVIAQGIKDGLDRVAIVERFLSDEGITVDPTVAELTAKAKAAGTGAKATGERKERKAPVRKPDEVKRALITALATFIAEADPHVKNVEITNIERMIAFDFGNEKFELTLVKKRPAKK